MGRLFGMMGLDDKSIVKNTKDTQFKDNTNSKIKEYNYDCINYLY
jgi:hypothetical protein